MHHFPHHIGDYAAATAHLTFVEDAAYHRLLRLYYRDEHALPEDVAACQRLAGARSKEERKAIETILREFFDLRPDGWHQHRADREIEAYQSRASSARENGKLGGRPRTRTEPTENPSGYLTEPIEKLTENRKPLTKNQNHSEEDHSVANAPQMPGKRGTRLTDDWRLTDDLRAFARDLGLDPDLERDAFTDYWTSVPGSKGLKLDWGKTFKNRCRELGKRVKPNGATSTPTETWNERRIRLGREALAKA